MTFKEPIITTTNVVFDGERVLTIAELIAERDAWKARAEWAEAQVDAFQAYTCVAAIDASVIGGRK